MKKLTALFLFALCFIPSASAHEKRQVSDYNFIVGFVNEPAFSGSMNGIDLRVLSGDKPVEGLEKTLKATVWTADRKQSMPLSFKPRHKEPGRYAAYFLPSQAGDYVFVIEGEIEGKTFKETFESGPKGFHGVEDAEALRFPPVSQ